MLLQYSINFLWKKKKTLLIEIIDFSKFFKIKISISKLYYHENYKMIESNKKF